MALIPVLHVAVDNIPVDPDWAGTPEILEGLFIALTSDGYATRADANDRVYGVAGDTQSNSTAATPYTAALIINSSGATRSTQNRVSDFYNETLASGKIAVYHSGGTFATDLFESNVSSAAPGTALYVSANGKLTTTNGGGSLVGTVKTEAGDWDSGVPGTDVNGSMSLGTYVVFKLEV